MNYATGFSKNVLAMPPFIHGSLLLLLLFQTVGVGVQQMANLIGMSQEGKVREFKNYNSLQTNCQMQLFVISDL